jgi:hypothetical protein
MTIEVFIFLFTIGSVISSLLTEAMKKAFKNISANVLAAANALIVGVGGTSSAFILMDIEYNAKNVVCVILMSVCIWIGSMVGYDKIKQTLEQFRKI